MQDDGNLTKDDVAGSPGENLPASDQVKVKEATAHRPAVVYEIIREKGETEMRRPLSALFWSGVAAGMSIGFSFLTQASLRAYLPEAPWQPLIANFGYCIGFLIVILGHQQLFTENVLTPVLPVIARKTPSWFWLLIRLWGIVLTANIVGCWLFSLAFAKLPIVSPEVSAAMRGLVEHLMHNTPYKMFAKGIGAGWLIACLVWIMNSTRGVEVAAITLLTYLIALFGFTHIVAGSTEVIYGWLVGAVDARAAALGFFLPTLLGNIFGGTVLFSVLSYAQVREEIFAEGAATTERRLVSFDRRTMR